MKPERINETGDELFGRDGEARTESWVASWTVKWGFMRAVVADTSLSRGALSVAFVLVDHANPTTGECFPSRGRIATLTGLTERSVSRSVLELEAVGYVQRVIGGGRRSTRYAIEWTKGCSRDAIVTGDACVTPDAMVTGDNPGPRGDAGVTPAVTQRCSSGVTPVSPEQEKSNRKKEEVEKKRVGASAGVIPLRNATPASAANAKNPDVNLVLERIKRTIENGHGPSAIARAAGIQLSALDRLRRGATDNPTPRILTAIVTALDTLSVQEEAND